MTTDLSSGQPDFTLEDEEGAALEKSDAPSDQPQEPTPPDPLAEVKLESILEHPALGEALKTFIKGEIDKAVPAAAQERANSMRLTIQQEEASRAEKEANDRMLDAYFERLSREELAQVLAQDDDMASEYSRRTQEKKQAATAVPEADIAQRGRVHGYAIQIATINRRLEASTLPSADKEKLDGRLFLTQDRGEQGLIDWGLAVDEALMQHRLTQLVNERLEAQRQEQLADNDDNVRPPAAVLTPGRDSAGGVLTKEAFLAMSFDDQARMWKERPQEVEALV